VGEHGLEIGAPRFHRRVSYELRANWKVALENYRECSQFHLLLPATEVNVCPGRANLSIGPVRPHAPDRCAGFLDYFFGGEADDDWIAEFAAWDDQVGAEDVGLVEGDQRGIASGAVEDGRLLAASEALIAAFQGHVRARVEPALG
jgi:hypothetical protein